MAFAIGIKVIKNKKDTDNLIDYQCLLSILKGILPLKKWRWRESFSLWRLGRLVCAVSL